MLRLPNCPLCDYKFRMLETFSATEGKSCPGCSKSLVETKAAKKATAIFGNLLGLYIGPAVVLGWMFGVGLKGALLLVIPVVVILALIVLIGPFCTRYEASP